MLNCMRPHCRGVALSAALALCSLRGAASFNIIHSAQRHISLRSPSYITNRGMSTQSPVARRSVAVYTEGQDMGELFDLYEAPATIGIQTAPLRPKGINKPRKLVHAEGDWHRAVHIFLVNDSGELVLQKRSKFKDTFPGMWDVSVGGHLSSGDDSLETARKEAEEELGISVDHSELKFLFTIATMATGSTERHGTFVCNEYKDVYLLPYTGTLKDLHFAPGEVEEIKFESWQSLREKQENKDPGYIIRPAAYNDGLFQAVQELMRERAATTAR